MKRIFFETNKSAWKIIAILYKNLINHKSSPVICHFQRLYDPVRPNVKNSKMAKSDGNKPAVSIVKMNVMRISRVYRKEY